MAREFLTDIQVKLIKGLEEPLLGTDAVNKAYSDLRAVPNGGITGQVLKKVSGNDYDTEWANESGGGGATGTLISIDMGTFPAPENGRINAGSF